MIASFILFACAAFLYLSATWYAYDGRMAEERGNPVPDMREAQAWADTLEEELHSDDALIMALDAMAVAMPEDRGRPTVAATPVAKRASKPKAKRKRKSRAKQVLTE